MPIRSPRRTLAAVTAGVLATATAGCAAETAAVKAPTGKGPLAGICPSTIVIQTDWYGTPERAGAFQLVGPNGVVDKTKGAYTGPLGDTGVNVEVRLGGPFLGGQPVPAQMYQDKEIFLGFVPTDDLVRGAAEFPVTGVFSSLETNPQIIMWDPKTYTIKSWKDVKGTGAKVVYSEGKAWMEYALAKGLVDKSQADASFDGTPARFVAEKGKVIQQAYVSNEPYRWEHDVDGWKKPVAWMLIADSGYESYAHHWSVRKEDLTGKAECLKKLVPMLQQAQVDYAENPGPVNDALVRIAKTIPDGPPITAAGNTDAAKVMLAEKIISNGSDDTLGDVDAERVRRVIDQVTPIFTARGDRIPAALKPSDLFTNEFLDKKIGLG